ncbi:MAG TPA: shikimate dehydrogenase [Bacillota bacterium]|nr:shikimate dehydrogenase [Bacillota bacterium]
MGTFAFIIHPIDVSDVARKFPVSRYIPSGLVERAISHLKPFKVSEINGVRSGYGTANGYFVTCPLTPRMMMSMPEDKVMTKIIDSAKLAQDLGAKVVGLGAFTSVVGDAGVTISKNVDIAVTTGNSYTVYTAIEATLKAAELMEIDMADANVLVLGATGSIGRVLSLILSDHGFKLILASRNIDKLNEVARAVKERSGATPYVTTDTREALRQADVVLCVSSAVEAIVQPGDLRTGALVCDVARPRNVSVEVKKQRQDVLVIEGGVVRVPGEVDFNFDFGFPKGHSYACMAETMILALEEKYVNWSLGRELTVEQVEGIAALARKHGFEVGGFRSFERPVTLDEIEEVKRKAAANRSR